MALAIALILLVLGSVLFHFLSPWWFTPLASNWGMIDDTVNLTFWVTGIVFVAVNLFMAYAIIRYRHKDGSRSEYEPENKKLEWWLTGLTTLGVVAMLAPGLFVWAKFIDVPEEAIEVEALGQQWKWSFRYPGEDGVLGATDVRYLDATNPFGVDPNDPNGQDDVLIPGAQVHLPKDQPVKFLLRSTDVLHDFAVPQFRVKMDLVPGLVSYLWLTPTVNGSYEILCEELCGTGHHAMRGRVVVEDKSDFDIWLKQQTTYAEYAARGPGKADAGQAFYTVCSACHGPEGEGNQALNAPRISGLGAWYLIRQLNNYKQGKRGYHEDDTFGRQMAPMAATLGSEEIVANVAAYIDSFSDKPALATITGDAESGKRLYVTCAVCHGADAQGNQATNAPRLAGMSDWYIAQQLEGFRSGLRGAHPDDIYGAQMTTMTPFLSVDPDSINNIVAYINTLGREE